MAVIAVLAERHLAQEEIAQRIDAIGLHQIERIDDIADDFDIFSPRLNRKPWLKMRLGTAMPADIKNAGQ